MANYVSVWSMILLVILQKVSLNINKLSKVSKSPKIFSFPPHLLKVTDKGESLTDTLWKKKNPTSWRIGEIEFTGYLLRGTEKQRFSVWWVTISFYFKFNFFNLMNLYSFFSLNSFIQQNVDCMLIIGYTICDLGKFIVQWSIWIFKNNNVMW